MAPPPSPPPGDLLTLSGVKFTVPPQRKPCVDRSDLVRSTAAAAPIVAVTAPAGYGKTTFLTQWARSEDRAVAWLSLDRFDDDPTALLVSIATSLNGVGLARGVGSPTGSDGNTSTLVSLAPRLASAIAAESTPFVLMLDDFHELHHEDCHDALGLLLNSLPTGSQIVTASRSQQPHVPRCRVQGDLVEIGPAQLALDRSGAREIFAASGHALSDDVADRLVERTEGWPAALYLAALVANDALDSIQDISGDDIFVSDYLHREALSRLPMDQQTFLVRTSVLERFSADTCNELLDSTTSEVTIRDIEASNLFLVPLDRRRSWYRYHSLFREFLLTELRRVEPDLEPILHRRAAAWFVEQNEPESAVSHLFLAGDHDEAVPLIQQHFRRVHNQGRAATSQHWLEELGPERIERHPGVGILACWRAALAGDAHEALRVAGLLDGAVLAPAPVQAQRAAVLSALCRDGVESMTTGAELALSLEPPSTPARPTTLTVLGESYLAAGRTDEAEAVIGRAVQAGRYPENSLSLIIGLADLAWFAMDRGDWGSAGDLLDRATDLAERSGTTDAIPALFVDAGAGRFALHRGSLDRARSSFTHALRSRAAATYALPTIAVRLRLRLATLALGLGQADTADELRRECVAVLEHRPAIGVLADEVDALGEHLTSVATARRSATSLTAAELRLLPYLQTHLTFREIGERLYVSRNTVNTQAGSIYRKLGVSTRGGAVDEATRSGLLGG